MDRDQLQHQSDKHDADQRDLEWEQALLRMEDDGCPNFPDHD